MQSNDALAHVMCSAEQAKDDRQSKDYSQSKDNCRDKTCNFLKENIRLSEQNGPNQRVLPKKPPRARNLGRFGHLPPSASLIGIALRKKLRFSLHWSGRRFALPLGLRYPACGRLCSAGGAFPRLVSLVSVGPCLSPLSLNWA